MYDNDFSWLNNKSIALATSVWPSGTALDGVILPPAPSFPGGGGGGGGGGDVAAQMAAAGGGGDGGGGEATDAPGIGLPPAIGERALANTFLPPFLPSFLLWRESQATLLHYVDRRRECVQPASYGMNHSQNQSHTLSRQRQRCEDWRRHPSLRLN